MRQPGGIRSKITFWFYLLLTFMIIISVISYGLVRKVEEKLINVETIDEFLENTLEVRRMEKNFLLYNDPASLEQGKKYLASMSDQLRENTSLFISLIPVHRIEPLQTALEEYAATFHLLGPASKKKTAVTVRSQGNRLTGLAEELVVLEHHAINRLIRFISNALLLMLPLLIISFATVAALLGRGIVSSLKQLEQHADTIVTGNFIEAPFTSNSPEVNSLITAFNRMSRELKNRQQQLVRSEKLAALGTMLAGVAHEVNNPLSNISSSAQILAEELEESGNELAHELLNQIIAETGRSAAIIRTLLDFARKENFHRAVYVLKPLFDELLVLLPGQQTQHMDIQLDIADDMTVFADKQKLQQVFLNLLNNSIDVLNEEGLLHIQARQDQEYLKIMFRDNGPGISEQIRDKIFDPFFTTKDTGKGSGLGLFLVHEIISRHNGTVTVENDASGGAVFTIILPTKETS